MCVIQVVAYGNKPITNDHLSTVVISATQHFSAFWSGNWSSNGFQILSTGIHRWIIQKSCAVRVSRWFPVCERSSRFPSSGMEFVAPHLLLIPGK